MWEGAGGKWGEGWRAGKRCRMCERNIVMDMKSQVQKFKSFWSEIEERTACRDWKLKYTCILAYASPRGGAHIHPSGSKFFHFSSIFGKIFAKQVCIPVGCIPPACCPYIPRGCLLLGVGCLLWGVSAPAGGVSQHVLRQTPPI